MTCHRTGFVGMIPNRRWEVGGHVPPNISVVCHIVKCYLLHPYMSVPQHFPTHTMILSTCGARKWKFLWCVISTLFSEIWETSICDLHTQVVVLYKIVENSERWGYARLLLPGTNPLWSVLQRMLWVCNIYSEVAMITILWLPAVIVEYFL